MPGASEFSRSRSWWTVALAVSIAAASGIVGAIELARVSVDW